MTLIDFWDVLGDWLKRRSCLLDWKGKANLSASFSRVEWGEIFISFTENAKDKADVSFFY